MTPNRASLFLTLPALVAMVATAIAEPIRTEVTKTASGWQLVRGGEPFYVKGGGGDGSKELLVQLGGNSFRTWGIGPDTRKRLDEAQRLGLAVTVGIWLGHERHGFDYNDPKQLAEQTEKVRAAVTEFKDHPAVLMWALGNEMEGYAGGDNPAIWNHVQSLAEMVKELDPNHPTMTVVAELGGQRVQSIHQMCPDIDVIGINAYAGAASIPQRYKAAGGTKPYIVTEFGPAGTWESPKTAWGAPIEPTSTQKAATYRRSYEGFTADTERCLGSYAFTWGNKQEATATWFGMLLHDGSRTPAADTMAELWGKPVANQAPRIDALSVSGGDTAAPGATVRVTLSASDPENDPLKVEWIMHREAEKYGTGGDAEAVPPTVPGAVVRSTNEEAELRMPAEAGAYRLYAYVRDGNGGAGVANVTLSVAPEKAVVRGAGVKLPLVVYGDGAAGKYAASGYMGEHAAITMNEASSDHPRSGTTCLAVTYANPGAWAGVVWQDPPNDWGDKAGGSDLRGATALKFWARGAKGGERVKFGFGVLGSDKPNPDSASGETEVALTDGWQEYSIPAAGKDLSRIKTGFMWVVAGQGAPLQFFLDDVRWE